MTDHHDPDLTELDEHLDAVAAADPRLRDWDAEVDHTTRIRDEAARVRWANRGDPAV